MSEDLTGQKEAEGQPAEAMPTSNEPAEEVQAEDELPEQVSERTKAEFEKLKQHNKALAEENAVLKNIKPSSTSVLDELRPREAEAVNASPYPGNTQVQTVQQPNAPEVFDDGGYVDTELLKRELAASRRAAEEARGIAAQTQRDIQNFQQTQVVKSVHAQYPHLDPNNVEHFDPVFYGLVRNELQGQMAIRGRGKENLQEAADTVQKLYQSLKPGTPTPAPSVAKQQETISKRVQASAPTGTSKGAPAPADHPQLVAQTMKGDRSALYQRLQASGN